MNLKCQNCGSLIQYKAGSFHMCPSGGKRAYYQGTYFPKNFKKYKGNHLPVFRSSWELTAFKMCDQSDAIETWQSEGTVIQYISPLDGRVHNYFMDLTITNGDRKLLVEIKPLKETRPPSRSLKPESYAKAMATWAVNSAKWEATEHLCKQNGWEFQKWTEIELVPGKKQDKEISNRTRQASRKRNKARKTKEKAMQAMYEKLKKEANQ